MIRKLKDQNMVALGAGVMVEVTKYSGTLGTCFEMCHYVIIVISADTHNLKKRKINVYMTWCVILPTVFVVMKETVCEVERVEQIQKTVERPLSYLFQFKIQYLLKIYW